MTYIDDEWIIWNYWTLGGLPAWRVLVIFGKLLFSFHHGPHWLTVSLFVLTVLFRLWESVRILAATWQTHKTLTLAGLTQTPQNGTILQGHLFGTEMKAQALAGEQ